MDRAASWAAFGKHQADRPIEAAIFTRNHKVFCRRSTGRKEACGAPKDDCIFGLNSTLAFPLGERPATAFDGPAGPKKTCRDSPRQYCDSRKLVI
jgi:hypothetical protein